MIPPHYLGFQLQQFHRGPWLRYLSKRHFRRVFWLFDPHQHHHSPPLPPQLLKYRTRSPRDSVGAAPVKRSSPGGSFLGSKVQVEKISREKKNRSPPQELRARHRRLSPGHGAPTRPDSGVGCRPLARELLKVRRKKKKTPNDKSPRPSRLRAAAPSGASGEKSAESPAVGAVFCCTRSAAQRHNRRQHERAPFFAKSLHGFLPLVLSLRVVSRSGVVVMRAERPRLRLRSTSRLRARAVIGGLLRDSQPPFRACTAQVRLCHRMAQR